MRRIIGTFHRSPKPHYPCGVSIADIRPMLATSAAAIPRGAEWTYEVKWDGYRTLALKQGTRVKLLSRNLKDATAQYPSVARAIAQVHGDAVLLDGEIVALDLW
jgi:bifunctional non-homologous end joining protein LigD